MIQYEDQGPGTQCRPGCSVEPVTAAAGRRSASQGRTESPVSLWLCLSCGGAIQQKVPTPEESIKRSTNNHQHCFVFSGVREEAPGKEPFLLPLG